ncbi:hypothetical protein [Actinoplanes sp. NPDC023714]|uniref:hypothetical protein n=1 Tax=Actinoplanes sp. NPDC023714 TaxID=3154322 RepID=UPI0033DEA2C7
MGTPSAVVDESPKLDRMSLRTIPLSSSTSGPFEPSPGYGPAVSSGISPDDDEEPDEEEPEEDDEGASDEEDDSLLHAANPSAAAPMPNARNTCRRPRRVPMSNPSPWSNTSSSW